eukprot:CAMPEP_0184326280 /NCGR_PEP_ID=MMETSP1049-20130417/142480_1 /TAXON_ID=77928 /ORGANISM="Proteomonas sulcata, Strain CCMP704" /LENGTH=125 /DNA_ID=CAMNT_0026648465 /DNA_START=261 /DNA_END=638 /DNA_ORIENTATION=+
MCRWTQGGQKCGKQASFGEPGGSSTYCTVHKLPHHVFLRGMKKRGKGIRGASSLAAGPVTVSFGVSKKTELSSSSENTCSKSNSPPDFRHVNPVFWENQGARGLGPQVLHTLQMPRVQGFSDAKV